MPFAVVGALLRSADHSFPEGIRRFTETPLHQNAPKPVWATRPLQFTHPSKRITALHFPNCLHGHSFPICPRSEFRTSDLFRISRFVFRASQRHLPLFSNLPPPPPLSSEALAKEDLRPLCLLAVEKAPSPFVPWCLRGEPPAFPRPFPPTLHHSNIHHVYPEFLSGFYVAPPPTVPPPPTVLVVPDNIWPNWWLRPHRRRW
jgi:hypothetical protein